MHPDNFVAMVMSFLDKLSDPVALFTGVLVILTGMMVWIAYRQGVSLKRVERAYVKISHYTPPGLVEDGANAIQIPFQIKNCGNTPAKITDVVIDAFTVESGTPLPPTPPYSREGSASRVNFFLVKGDTFDYTSHFDDVSLDKVKSGEQVLYVFAYVDYVDQFDTKHRYGYARRYHPADEENNLHFVTEPHYNYDYERR